MGGSSFVGKPVGFQGGSLETTGRTKGQGGDKRFTRVVGIGKDSVGNLYILNNPWGGTWDLGRGGGTDIHAYNSAGTLQCKLQSLNFEAIAAPDSGTDGAYFYCGTNLYTRSPRRTLLADTVDL